MHARPPNSVGRKSEQSDMKSVFLRFFAAFSLLFANLEQSYSRSISIPYTAQSMARSDVIARAEIKEIAANSAFKSNPHCYKQLVKVRINKVYKGNVRIGQSLVFISKDTYLKKDHEYVFFLPQWRDKVAFEACLNDMDRIETLGVDQVFFLSPAYVSEYEVIPPHTLPDQNSEFFLSRSCDGKFDVLFGGRANSTYPLVEVPSNLFRPEQCKYRAGYMNILEERIQGLLTDKH